MSRKLVTSVAVVAALAAFSSASVASAAPAKSAAKPVAAKKVTSKKSTRRPTVRNPRATVVVYVKGTSTGKGPASNAECAGIAADIDTAVESMADYMIENMDDEAQGMSEAIDELEAKGIKRGCAFTY